MGENLMKLLAQGSAGQPTSQPGAMPAPPMGVPPYVSGPNAPGGMGGIPQQAPMMPPMAGGPNAPGFSPNALGQPSHNIFSQIGDGLMGGQSLGGMAKQAAGHGLGAIFKMLGGL